VKDPVFFTIVMPVFNCEAYLNDAIQSVIDQAFEDWELIIIDDGSQDNSYSVAHNHMINDNRIRILQHEDGLNKGVSTSRNLGVENSRGDWISLLDADDLWKPEKLEKEFEVINSHPEVVLIYSLANRLYTGLTPGNHNNGSLYGSGISGEVIDPFKKLISGFTASTSSVTFRRETFIKCNGFNEKFSFSEDTLLFHKLMEHGNVFFLDTVLGVHRSHNSSTVSTTSFERKIAARFDVYEELLMGVRKENIPVVSEALVSTGLKKVLRTFILYPYNRIDLVWRYQKKILNNPAVEVRYKIKAIFILITEVLISPLKTIWLKLKNINSFGSY